ncbi:thioredoxin-related protein [Azomonas agilis]|uniref:Thioredoxin-related protein n=1 Tax=Azomonas agilis TaxID=116849 RepID=A0A562I278_9GAMM|nr:thioredoxin fold domain-containing protein [Azomonas agilis]TWH64788.1 thioredoxin-related protein [Azomonas agilis]
MKQILLSLGLILCAVPVSAALFSEHTADLAALQQQAVSQGKRLVVAFELTDCLQCQHMRDQVFGQAAVEAAYQPYYRSAPVLLDDLRPLQTPDGQQRTAAEWAKTLGVVGTPAFVFFDAQGQLETRYQGVLSAEDLIRLGRYVQHVEYEQHPFRAQASAAHQH